MCHVSAGVNGGQQGVSDPLELGCWELSAHSTENQQLYLTTELSPKAKTYFLM